MKYTLEYGAGKISPLNCIAKDFFLCSFCGYYQFSRGKTIYCTSRFISLLWKCCRGDKSSPKHQNLIQMRGHPRLL